MVFFLLTSPIYNDSNGCPLKKQAHVLRTEVPICRKIPSYCHSNGDYSYLWAFLASRHVRVISCPLTVQAKMRPKFLADTNKFQTSASLLLSANFRERKTRLTALPSAVGHDPHRSWFRFRIRLVALPIEYIFVGDRKYLRCQSQVSSLSIASIFVADRR